MEDDGGGVGMIMESEDGSPLSMSSPAPTSESSEREEFPVLGEVELEHSVRLSCWSPTMDVFACAYEESTDVDLFHMNLRRLWTIKRSKKVISMAWKPDGTWLALGDDGGAVTLVETETGDAHVGATPTDLPSGGDPIALLHWQDANDWVPAGREGHSVSGFSLLCSCDSSLRVCVSAHGLIPLARVGLREHVESSLPPSAPAGERTFVPLALSANGSFTQVLVSFSCEGAGGGEDKVLMSAVLDTSALGDMRADVWHWADYISALEGEVSALRTTAKSLRPHLSHLCQNYPYILHRGPSGPGDENFEFEVGNGSKYQLTRAKLSKSLLLGYASVANSMVLQKSCKSSAVDVDKALEKLFQVVTHDFLPRLEAVYEHLRGYSSRSSSWGGGFLGGESGEGQETRAMEEVFSHASQAISLARELQPSILRCSRQAREYFSWLHSSQLSLDKEELPHSQVKALLQSKRICSALVGGGGGDGQAAGTAKPPPYMDWASLNATLEEFQEQVASLAYCFGKCILLPCKIFSSRVALANLDTLETVGTPAGSHHLYRVAADLVAADEEGTAQDFWNVVVYRVHGNRARVYTVSSAGLAGQRDLSFEEGEISSFAFYKWPYLAWTVGSEGSDEASMVIMSRKGDGEDGGVGDVSVSHGASDVRSRALGGEGVEYFAVSKNRGTAYVQDGAQNVVVFDLEDG